MSSVHTTQTLKFLYSYGGKIVPRRSDGELRYVGGFTRVLAVNRSICFSELMVKFGESCGISMSLKCKLPTEDLDVLVTITNDEDLANLIAEYDRVSALRNEDMKIRAVLYPVKLPNKKITSPPSSPVSCFDFPALNVKPEKIGRFNPPPSYAAARGYSSPALSYPVNLPKKKISPPSSPVSCFDFPALSAKPEKVGRFNRPPLYAATRGYSSPVLGYPAGRQKDNERLYYPYGHGSVRPLYYYVPHHHY